MGNGCAQGVKTLRNTFEVNPTTGQIGGMGRSYAQPKHSDGGAYENIVKKTNNNNQHARNGYEYQPERGYQYSQSKSFQGRHKKQLRFFIESVRHRVLMIP